VLLAPLLAVATSGACGHASAGSGADASVDDGGTGGLDVVSVDVGGVDGDPGPQLDVPVIDVGADAIRHWDRWPYQRIGTRTIMRSTYDRTGGNEAADASHFLRATPTYYVPLDVEGQGDLVFERTNHWHGSPWHYVVDGQDTVVSETSTQNPDHPTTPATFLPASAFPSPLALTWPVTQGADVSWVPVTFTSSLLLGYERSHYGTGYYVVDLYPPGATNLSQPLAAWSAQPPAQEVVDLVASAGQDIAPSGASVTTQTGQVDLAAGATTTIAALSGSSTLRALRFTVPLGEEQAFGRGRIRITWDGRSSPSVDAPLSLFFGTGSLYDRDHRPYLVQALPVHVRFDAASVELATYFPMPFFRSARVEVVAQDPVPGVAWEVRTQPYTDPPSWVGYFHATYRDHGVPAPGQDLVLLDTTQEEGGGDWSGSFVGTSFVFSDRAVLGTLEGDPRFFFDDSQTPQAQGTGTEEWGAGGDYWMNGQTTTLAFAGHPVGAPSAAAAANAEDLVESAYRFLLSDAMPFGRNARIQLEHGGVDDSTEHYRTVAFWYGLPGASLVQSDALHVGDPADEASHAYLSPDAAPVETLTSRYEWGVDHVGSTETYPATTDTGRHTTGTSSFTIALTPGNYGVLLRRKLDYAYPDQRAVVSVADDRDGAAYVVAGTWYLAGGSTVVYANASTETGTDPGTVETSPHRWRDDEFIVPRQLTEGRASVRVRVEFAPANHSLAPGVATAPQAWSEFRYTAYCWVLPPAP
jgi:hypothetical protein